MVGGIVADGLKRLAMVKKSFPFDLDGASVAGAAVVTAGGGCCATGVDDGAEVAYTDEG